MSFKDTILHRLLRVPYKLQVIDHGGKGPVIIFLHGIASSSTNWEYMLPLLKNDYRCITLDLLGFGKSPKPEWAGYTVDEHINSIHNTIVSLRIRGPYIIVGHSMGSLLAVRYAALHPSKVKRLVLLSPPIYLQPEKISDKAAKRWTSAYLRAYRFIRTHRRITPQNVLRLARIIPLPKAFVMDEATWVPFVRSLEHCIEKQTVLDDITQVKAQIDVFYGTFDQFIVPKNVKLLAERQNITLHTLKVDHAVGRRFAKAVAKTLTS